MRDADAIRARVPDVLRSYAQTRATVLEGGAVDQDLKLLCARFLANEDVEGTTARERAALDWAEAVAWDDRRADDALWAEHAHFSEPELVELRLLHRLHAGSDALAAHAGHPAGSSRAMRRAQGGGRRLGPSSAGLASPGAPRRRLARLGEPRQVRAPRRPPSGAARARRTPAIERLAQRRRGCGPHASRTHADSPSSRASRPKTVPPSSIASRGSGGNAGRPPSRRRRTIAARSRGAWPDSHVAAPSHSQAQRT